MANWVDSPSSGHMLRDRVTETRCCACGRRAGSRRLIVIGGMPVHLTCALDRRLAAKR